MKQIEVESDDKKIGIDSFAEKDQATTEKWRHLNDMII